MSYKEVIETYKGFRIEVSYGEAYESPREWDNLGHMLFYEHRRYSLGDEQTTDLSERIADLMDIDYDSTETSEQYDKAIERAKKLFNDYYVWLPIYSYEHGSISFSTSREYPYNCQWDSAFAGIIYASKADIRKEYKVKRITPSLLRKVHDILISEIETYNQYVNGDIYDYVILDKDDEIVDSCSGFYGSNFEDNALLEYARNAIDCHVKSEIRTHLDKVKVWIKNRVPLTHRTPLQIG